MPAFFAISVLGVFFVGFFFVNLCREPRRQDRYEVWYIRGLIRRNLEMKRTASKLRRAA